MVQLQEFTDYKTPRRRPWLLLIVLIVIGAGIWLAVGHKSTKKAETPSDIKTDEVSDVTNVTSKSMAPRKVTVSVTIHDVDIKMLVVEAEQALQKGDLLAARDSYLSVLEKSNDAAVCRQVEGKLGEINIKLVMSPLPMPHDKIIYLVKNGDFLGKIARKNGTTVQLIQQSNNLANPNRIKKGDRLLVLKGTFSIDVSKSKNELLLKLNNKFFKRYSVATGKFGKTPEGTFKITQKTVEPVWWSPDGKEVPYGDPKNILGTRWMTLKATGKTPDARGYGIHGTWLNNSIGKAASAGCVRMHNSDVEELFTLVPAGTKVVISE